MNTTTDKHGNRMLLGHRLPENVELTQAAGLRPQEFTLVKLTEDGRRFAVSISTKERTVAPGYGTRYRRYREEVPHGKGWARKLVEEALAILEGLK